MAALAHLAAFLFLEIETSSEPTDLELLGTVLDEIKPMLDAELDGVGTELWLWLGLKQDGLTVMANDYASNLRAHYRSLLQDKRPA